VGGNPSDQADTSLNIYGDIPQLPAAPPMFLWAVLSEIKCDSHQNFTGCMYRLAIPYCVERYIGSADTPNIYGVSIVILTKPIQYFMDSTSGSKRIHTSIHRCMYRLAYSSSNINRLPAESAIPLTILTVVIHLLALHHRIVVGSTVGSCGIPLNSHWV